MQAVVAVCSAPGRARALMSRFKKWGIDLRDVVIATPSNKIGFQMNPSRSECEKALRDLPEPNVIAMSVLAAGYLGIPEAREYVKSLPNVRGLVVGVSRGEHASKTFKLFKEV
jgi:hypothetical protein